MRTASTWRTIGRRALPAGMLSVLAFIPAVAFDPMPAVKKIWDWYLAHVPGDGLNRRLQPD